MEKEEKLIIETKNLCFSFWNKSILDNIELKVPEKSIYGLLGLNGSGKTTLIRLLLGLYQSNNSLKFSYIKIFDKFFSGATKVEILQKVGSLIEHASLYEYMTGIENLEIIRRIYKMPKSRISEVLEIVGLSERGNEKVRKYSMGMKQRLGIAMAIISKPSVIILDEPVNGLDPTGVLDIRNLIKKLNTEFGVSFLITSHLLSELELVATHLGILHQGKLVYQNSMENLQKDFKKNQFALFKIKYEQINEALNLVELNNFKATNQSNNELLIEINTPEQSALINEILVKNNISVWGFEVLQKKLEDFFMEIISSLK